MDSFGSKYGGGGGGGGGSSSFGSGGGGSSSFGGGSYGGGGGGSASPNQAAQIKATLEQAAQQMQMEHIQGLIQNTQTECFKRCVTKPGDKMSSYEKECMSNCADRFQESFGVVAKAFAEQAQRQ